MMFEEKIQTINREPEKTMLIPLASDSAETIAEFWEKAIEPLLPDYTTMKKWHELLIKYVSLKGTVFMIRKGNEESKEYMESVAADALRRGFLTKTNSDFWFFYNDNDFATYMLNMVLDGDIIDTLDEKDLLTYFKTPGSIVRFNKSGSGGVEKKKAYFAISGPRPRISQNGYTVAHIFDVNDHYYDENLGLVNAGGEEALRSSGINIDKGMYSDYVLKEHLSGRDIYYRENYNPGNDARRFLEAHMLRFLHPLNYFCAPKDNMNGLVYCEFTDHINNGKSVSRRFHRISGYKHLLHYAHYRFKEKYMDIYDDFLDRIMVPTETFSFFENCSSTPGCYGDEVIDIQYGNPLFSSAVISKYTQDEKLGVAVYYLRHNEGLIAVEEKHMRITGGRGWRARDILLESGVDTSGKLKNLLNKTSIDNAIAKATNPKFKETLEKIKDLGL